MFYIFFVSVYFCIILNYIWLKFSAVSEKTSKLNMIAIFIFRSCMWMTEIGRSCSTSIFQKRGVLSKYRPRELVTLYCKCRCSTMWIFRDSRRYRQSRLLIWWRKRTFTGGIILISITGPAKGKRTVFFAVKVKKKTKIFVETVQILKFLIAKYNLFYDLNVFWNDMNDISKKIRMTLAHSCINCISTQNLFVYLKKTLPLKEIM